MYSILITWPGVIVGVFSTILIETLAIIIYAVSKYWK